MRVARLTSASGTSGVRMMLVGSLMVIATGIFVAGCQTDGDGSLSSTANSSTALIDDVGAILPSMADLESTLLLTSVQSEPMKTALGVWRSSVESRYARRLNMRGRSDRRRSGNSQRSDDRFHGGEARERPILEFLVTSADLLTTDQFVMLTNLLAENRQSHMTERPNRRPIRGESDSKRRIEWLADELALTEDQIAKLADLLRDQRQTIRMLHEENEFPNNHDLMRDAVQEVREQFTTDLQAVLTFDQIADWKSLRDRRREERFIQSEKASIVRQERHLLFLSRVLDLNEGQQDGLQSILAESQNTRRDVIEGPRNDDDSFDSVRDDLKSIRMERDDAVRSLLNSEQAIRYDALQVLRMSTGLHARGHRGMRGSRNRIFGQATVGNVERSAFQS